MSAAYDFFDTNVAKDPKSKDGMRQPLTGDKFVFTNMGWKVKGWQTKGKKYAGEFAKPNAGGCGTGTEYTDKYQGQPNVSAGCSKKLKNHTKGQQYNMNAFRNRLKGDKFVPMKNNTSQLGFLFSSGIQKVVWTTEMGACYKGRSPQISMNPGILATATKQFHNDAYACNQ